MGPGWLLVPAVPFGPMRGSMRYRGLVCAGKSTLLSPETVAVNCRSGRPGRMTPTWPKPTAGRYSVSKGRARFDCLISLTTPERNVSSFIEHSIYGLYRISKGMVRFDCLASLTTPVHRTTKLMLKKMDLKCPLLSLVWQQKEISSFKLTAVIKQEACRPDSSAI